MSNPRLVEIIRLLDPEPGTRLWHGGASTLGCLRGVAADQAAWKPHPDRHSIWALTLHLAYWKYAVRRHLDDSPMGSFPRSPSNWPAVPDPPDERSWKDDRTLLRREHEQLVAAIRGFDPGRLDEEAPGSGAYRLADLLYGIAMHDAYHVGQIQMLKRIYQSGSTGTGR
jgi:hypothetical protein